MDLAFGHKDFAAGFLIRGIRPVAGGPAIEGPCKVVDHILSATKRATIVDYVAACGEEVPPLSHTCASGSNAMFLAPATKPREYQLLLTVIGFGQCGLFRDDLLVAASGMR